MRPIDLTKFFDEMAEDGKGLSYFAEILDCSVAFLSRVKHGGKKLSYTNGLKFFEWAQKHYNEGWTYEKYHAAWPEIHARYLERQEKIAKFRALPAKSKERMKPPCDNCGDPFHEGRACSRCESGCKAYSPWVHRGRYAGTGRKLTAKR